MDHEIEQWYKVIIPKTIETMPKLYNIYYSDNINGKILFGLNYSPQISYI